MREPRGRDGALARARVASVIALRRRPTRLCRARTVGSRGDHVVQSSRIPDVHVPRNERAKRRNARCLASCVAWGGLRDTEQAARGAPDLDSRFARSQLRARPIARPITAKAAENFPRRSSVVGPHAMHSKHSSSPSGRLGRVRRAGPTSFPATNGQTRSTSNECTTLVASPGQLSTSCRASIEVCEDRQPRVSAESSLRPLR